MERQKLNTLPLFWIESENPKDEFISEMKERHPLQIRGNLGDNALMTVQRMTQADGLILAVSSLSNVGFLLNNRTRRTLIDQMSDTATNQKQRHNWYKSKSFIDLNKTLAQTNKSYIESEIEELFATLDNDK